MSPIFVRPVREQLEHDRLIRQLHLKYKRKFDVAVNMGEEQLAPVKIGQITLYPDLVLTSARKLAGVVEVESGESVNNLEAMAQWVHFSRARVPFHLYVPVQMYEAARRLCDAYQARVTEIWTYRPLAEEFDLVRMHVDTGHKPAAPRPAKAAAPAPAPVPVKAAAKPAPAAKPAEKPAPKKAKAAPARKPAAKAAKPRPVAKKKATAPRKAGGARKR